LDPDPGRRGMPSLRRGTGGVERRPSTQASNASLPPVRVDGEAGGELVGGGRWGGKGGGAGGYGRVGFGLRPRTRPGAL
jgi:hypothetical protein